jgi:hypothetical protein
MALVFSAPPVHAADDITECCDPAIWNAMKKKAELESHYETMVNESFVFKPDSVFDYSCFEMYVYDAAEYTGPIFSENQEWGPVPGHDLQSFDRWLQVAVMNPLATYLANNFNHAFLGGRAPHVANSQCKVMDDVWHAAKCRNFLQDEIDGFFTFEELDQIVKDFRELPMPCNNPPDWRALIKASYDYPEWWPDYLMTTSQVYMMVGKLLQPGACTNPRSPAHVIVRSYPSGKYPDGICTNPGCVYNGSRCVLN